MSLHSSLRNALVQTALLYHRESRTHKTVRSRSGLFGVRTRGGRRFYYTTTTTTTTTGERDDFAVWIPFWCLVVCFGKRIEEALCKAFVLRRERGGGLLRVTTTTGERDDFAVWIPFWCLVVCFGKRIEEALCKAFVLRRERGGGLLLVVCVCAPRVKRERERKKRPEERRRRRRAFSGGEGTTHTWGRFM